MDKIETGEANMDAKMLDGREVVADWYVRHAPTPPKIGSLRIVPTWTWPTA